VRRRENANPGENTVGGENIYPSLCSLEISAKTPYRIFHRMRDVSSITTSKGEIDSRDAEMIDTDALKPAFPRSVFLLLRLASVRLLNQPSLMRAEAVEERDTPEVFDADSFGMRAEVSAPGSRATGAIVRLRLCALADWVAIFFFRSLDWNCRVCFCRHISSLLNYARKLFSGDGFAGAWFCRVQKEISFEANRRSSTSFGPPQTVCDGCPIARERIVGHKKGDARPQSRWLQAKGLMRCESASQAHFASQEAIRTSLKQYGYQVADVPAGPRHSPAEALHPVFFTFPERDH